MPGQPASPLPFHIEQEIPHAVAVGRGSVIDLRIRLPERIEGPVTVSAGDRTVPLHGHRTPAPLTIAGEPARIHATLMPLEEISRPTTIELHLSCPAGRARIGRSLLMPAAWPAAPADLRPGPAGGDGLVVVCMTTYEPDEALLTRQIRSILDQTYPNIALIVCDDASSMDVAGLIAARFGNEAGITVFRNRRNLGFYHNFERALSLVPRQASYVSLADQDDFWYPDKIASTVARFRPETDLVFCDAAIRTRDGDLLSETYWTSRRPYDGPLDALLTLNTVTGGGAVIRRSLLDRALPFPPNLGGAFHDHWLACCARAGGGISFLDHPLYDYIQHDHNVTGHVQSKHAGVLKGRLEEATLALAGRLSKGVASRRDARRAHLGQVYWHWYRQLQIHAACLELRFPENASAMRETRAMFLERHTVPALKAAHGRYRNAGLDTNNVEALFVRAAGVAGPF